VISTKFITKATGREISSGNFVPNFKLIGPKYGKHMKQIAGELSKMNQTAIRNFEQEGKLSFNFEGDRIELTPEDVEIISEDIPGWEVSSEGGISVALDISINDELKEEGIARELVNRIQNFRKEKGYEVTDRIHLMVKEKGTFLTKALNNNKHYICAETLADDLEMVADNGRADWTEIELDADISTSIAIEKINS